MQQSNFCKLQQKMDENNIIIRCAEIVIFVADLNKIRCDDKDEKIIRAFKLAKERPRVVVDIFSLVTSAGFFIWKFEWNSLKLEILIQNKTSEIELMNFVNSEEFRKRINKFFSEYDLKIQFDYVEHSSKEIQLKNQFENLKKLTEEAVQDGRFLVDNSRRSVSGLFKKFNVLNCSVA